MLPGSRNALQLHSSYAVWFTSANCATRIACQVLSEGLRTQTGQSQAPAALHVHKVAHISQLRGNAACVRVRVWQLFMVTDTFDVRVLLRLDMCNGYDKSECVSVST